MPTGSKNLEPKWLRNKKIVAICKHYCEFVPPRLANYSCKVNSVAILCIAYFTLRRFELACFTLHLLCFVLLYCMLQAWSVPTKCSTTQHTKHLVTLKPRLQKSAIRYLGFDHSIMLVNAWQTNTPSTDTTFLNARSTLPVRRADSIIS